MLAATGVLVGVVAGVGATTASAEDPIIASKSLLADPKAPDGSRITKATYKDNRNIRLYVYSTAMDETFPVDVQRPADASVPRPTLYLLNGAGGGEDDASWVKKTDIVNGFLGDKNVNVVQVIGGKWSYYTDWLKDDPVLGRNKWKTFFTEELPPLIDGALGTNGINAIAGLSTSGTTVLNLPIAKPGLYKAAAAYSGCAQTSDPAGREFVKLTVNVWGGGDVRNMYGDDNNPAWAENDPYVNAEKLRGTELYLSTGNGLPGQYDTLDNKYALPGSYGLANQIVIGGVIEAGTNFCTHNMQNKLNALGIPATYNFRNGGTHSWGYWRDDFMNSWPVLAHGLGL
ncbi:esterase family protein [Nocardia sp. CDC159]|uniref:Esterase family protein n=1 Tax=Nocardia pulmonis TaxID=2951408 RepID=A0A9X2J0I4_9NOCA|nr:MULTISPECIES: alpha/beta hydrolase family protein [Nocardia]MCM6775976.1 esterase family protein [Nocardia pulmonis]MCM6788697.1 esterase family protein [Nocardia sp. CDC159]